MRIDIHNHAYPPTYLDALRRSGAYEFGKDADGQEILISRGARVVTLMPEMLDLDSRIKTMNRAGVDVQVLSVTAPGVCFTDAGLSRELARLSNEYLAEAAKHSSGCYLCMASVPINHPTIAMEELAYAVDVLKMNAVIVGTNIAGERLDHPRFRSFFAEVARRNVPVMLHPMAPWGAEQMADLGLAPLVGFIFETTLTVSRMVFAGVFQEIPSLKLILPHTGGAIPFIWERLNNGWRVYPESRKKCPELPESYLKNLFYDTVSFHIPALRAAYETVGARRLILGTDYPHVIGDMPRAVKNVQEMGISQSEQEQIYSGNARGLLANLNLDGAQTDAN